MATHRRVGAGTGRGVAWCCIFVGRWGHETLVYTELIFSSGVAFLLAYDWNILEQSLPHFATSSAAGDEFLPLHGIRSRRDPRDPRDPRVAHGTIMDHSGVMHRLGGLVGST
jgi:hypothetical protein